MSNGEGTLSECEDKSERSGETFWIERVRKAGNHKSPFLDMPKDQIDKFTEWHNNLIDQYSKGKRCLEICCGYGRNIHAFCGAKSYLGIDCVPELVKEAQENAFKVRSDFKVIVSELKQDTMAFENFSFDLIVGVAAVTSLESQWTEILRMLKRPLRPGGMILWLEPEWMRIDFK